MRKRTTWAASVLIALFAFGAVIADEPKEANDRSDSAKASDKKASDKKKENRSTEKTSKKKTAAQEAEKDQAGAKVEVAQIFRSADVMSLDVRNHQGKDIGSMTDLVVELNTGEIRYAALSFGGFAGFNDKLFAVPWKAIKFKFDEDDRYLVVDMTEEKLERAHGFNEDKWPNVADPNWAKQVDEDFAGSADKEEAEAPQEKPGNKTVGDKVVYDAVYRVSSLKGLEVRNSKNQDLGQIEELAFDLRKGKVAYAAMSHGGVLGVGDKLFAVPFGAFTLKHETDEKFLVLNVSQEKFENAPGFDQEHWPNAADPQWRAELDNYYELSRKPAGKAKAAPRKE